MDIFVKNLKETLAIGKSLGALAKPGDIFCLDGDLGAGKTHLTKGIAEGLSIEDNITSPTFTIVNEYEGGRLKLNHFDVYRVNDPDEIYAIGFDEYIFSEGLSVIEWSDYIKELIPEEYLQITILKCTEGEEARKIILTPHGSRYDYIKELKI